MTEETILGEEIPTVEAPLVEEEKPKKRGRKKKEAPSAKEETSTEVVKEVAEPVHDVVSPETIARQLGAVVIFKQDEYFTLSKPAMNSEGKNTGTLIHGINTKGLTEQAIIDAFVNLGY
jgi:hypothetical protein